MPRGKKAAPKQESLTDPDSGVAIDAEPDRDPELHALWVELVDAQDALKAAQETVATVKAGAAKALHARGIDHYKVGPADLWIEPGSEKVKAKRAGGRPRGKVTKVTKTSGPTTWGPDDDDEDDD